MQNFKESLKAGRLVTSKCTSCKDLIWPPAEVCPKCIFSRVEWVDLDPIGVLVDFSESIVTGQKVIFGVVELHNKIRLLARITSEPDKGLQKNIPVRLRECGLRGNDAYYEFQPM